jgi:hypothetical protein
MHDAQRTGAFGIVLQARCRPLGAAGDTEGRRFLARRSRRPSVAQALKNLATNSVHPCARRRDASDVESFRANPNGLQ